MVAVCVIRGSFAFFRSSRSRLTFSVCQDVYLLVRCIILSKIERDLYLLRVDRFSFGNANMAKIHQSFLSTIIPQEKDLDSFDPRSQILSGKESTRMVDRLVIPRVVDCFFFLLITRLNCFGFFRT